MHLQLTNITKRVGADVHLHELTLSLVPGTVNVLLGRTLAGKTSLMRLMAGLDRPTSGRILIDDRDVTGVPVRERNLAMVYQQFINYPSLTVYENIASPLRLQRHNDSQIKQRVGEIAETLRLTPYLDRHPAELSGGQQQRTALARALAKDAELLLLDEPLVNLDYKLREELRQELSLLFRNGRTTVVYATTEPQEALQLGGHTAILDAGKLLQAGPTLDTFLRPTSLAAARAFSDPPLNLLHSGIPLPATLDQLSSQQVQLAVRAHHIRAQRHRDTDIAIDGKVDLAEISGSDTYLHVEHHNQSLVAQLPGVHDFTIGDNCTLFISPADLYGFNAQGDALFTPAGA